MPMAPGIFSGIHVLDLSTQVAGPYCSMMLGEMGADVIKIEHPTLGDATRHQGPPFIKGESSLYLSANRNKRSVTLDVGSPKVRPIVVSLLEWADVVAQNFRPDIAIKFGLDYEAVSAVNPRAVYLSISAFGEEGPYRMKAGTDTVFQGMGGVMTVSGLEGEPPVKVGAAIADHSAGLYSAFAVAAALYERQQTNQGRKIEVSLLDSLIALQTARVQEFFITGRDPVRMGYTSPFGSPISTFKTSDSYLCISCLSDKFWGNLCKAIGRPELAMDPRFLTNELRAGHTEELFAILDEVLSRRTTDEWRKLLDAADVPNGPVYTYTEMFDDPQVKRNGIRSSVHHTSIGPLDVVGLPLRIPGVQIAPRRAPPLKGEHTLEVLEELGVPAAEVCALRDLRLI